MHGSTRALNLLADGEFAAISFGCLQESILIEALRKRLHTNRESIVVTGQTLGHLIR